MLKKIANFSYYFLAVVLTFGSVNPFSVKVDNSVIGEQEGFTPIVLLLCIIFSLLDSKVSRTILKFKPFIRTFLFFDIIILVSGLFYGLEYFNESLYFFIKLLLCQFSFLVFSAYFICNPLVLQRSFYLYQIACTIIIALFLLGFLNSVLYFSNGRVFLFGINPNTYSFMMGLGLLYALYDFLYNKPFVFRKILDITSVFLISIYILMSGSRGTFIFCILACIIITGKFIVKKIYVVIPVVLIGILGISSYVHNSSEEISIFGRFAELKEGDSRGGLIDRSIDIYLDSPIIIGIGNAGYKAESLLRYRDPRDSHNMLISTLVMGGFLGLCFLIRFLYLLFNKISLSHFSNKLSLALFVYMFLISLKTGWVLTYALMWYVFAIVLSLTYSSCTTLKKHNL